MFNCCVPHHFSKEPTDAAFLSLFFAPLLITAAAGFCRVNAVEIIDPAEARKDPDFLVQGEYLGEGVTDSGEKERPGQVIALGKGEFSIVGYTGGLPGEGWKMRDHKTPQPDRQNRWQGSRDHGRRDHRQNRRWNDHRDFSPR